MPRPKKFYDETGLCRVTLKKGNERQPGGPTPHAQYAQADGRRVNAVGLPVGRTSPAAFVAIQWDFDDDPDDNFGEDGDALPEADTAAPEPEALDFDEVSRFAFKSPTLYQGMQALDATGFALLEGPTQESNQVIVAACRILIDPAVAAQHTLTGVVAREMGRALSVFPKVSARDRARVPFAQANATASMKEEGDALLFAADVRQELLDASGPDISVPGLSSEANAIAAAVRVGSMPRAQAAELLGPKALLPAIPDARARYEELWAEVYDLLTADPRRPFTIAGAQDLIDAVFRLSTSSAFDRARIQEILGAELFPIAGANPEHVVSTAAFDAGPFATAELVEPGPYSRLAERRLVLTPSGALSVAALAGWYGPGNPMHLDGRAEDPLATVGYVVERQEIAFTFSVAEGDVRFVTIRRAR